MKDFGIVICSRADSERVPNKVFRKINGIPCIERLIINLLGADIPIIVAIPIEQYQKYNYLRSKYGVTVYASEHANDPLARNHEVAELYQFKNVIRVTHDKIFVDPYTVKSACHMYKKTDSDYLFSSKLTPGCGFEIISAEVLRECAYQYKNVEHISYAVREVAKRKFDFTPKFSKPDLRLLIDYPEDMQLMEILHSQLGENIHLEDIAKYLNKNSDLKKINELPKVTVYTCAYNADRFLNACMLSVEMQEGFKTLEYIIIDDFSSDKTSEMIAKFAVRNKNVKWIRNQENLGLASSSNLALKHARGKYIIRLDADDTFVSSKAIASMVKEIEKQRVEALYPDNYFGDMGTVQKGNECHHIGGTLFDKNAINYIKFSDGLRGYEGLDFFNRAKDRLNIGYLDKPMFFYTQRPDSLSKTDIKKREEIKKGILNAQA
jgi:spore coat polysaccharide biosynthesis protein SpsF (cytidylyltransferase family)